jgi:hypothetical protein
MGRGSISQANGRQLLFGSRQAHRAGRILDDSQYLARQYPPRIIYPKRVHSEMFARLSLILDGPRQTDSEGRTLRFHLAIGPRPAADRRGFVLVSRRERAGQATNDIVAGFATLSAAVEGLNRSIERAAKRGYTHTSEPLTEQDFHRAWLSYPRR